jgi:hypothetical protein
LLRSSMNLPEALPSSLLTRLLRVSQGHFRSSEVAAWHIYGSVDTGLKANVIADSR